MNFKISKKAFYNSLSTVSRSISSNSPIPALTGIKIEVTNESIIIVGSNSDVSIQRTLLCEDSSNNIIIIETGSIVIEARYILEIVRKIDSNDITVNIVDGCLTKISGNNAKFEINGIKAIDYPSLDFSKPVKQFEIDSDLLLKVINQTTFAASDKETRPVLTGVNFRAYNNSIECISTDSYRLAKKIINIGKELDFNITIPSKSLNEISKIIDKECSILVCVSDKKAQFWIDNTLIQTRLIDGFYPETSRLIPVSFESEMTVDSRDLLNAIDRASFIKNDGISIIKISINDKNCIVSTKSQEVGSSTEELSFITFSGNPIELSFSGRYVYDAIKSLNTPNITLYFSGVMKPFIIKTNNDDSILQLVLPVRTYN